MKKLLFIVIVFLSAAVYSETIPIESENTIKKQIATELESSVSCWNNGNLNCFMQSYENSDKTLFISGDKFIFGWQSSFDHYMKKYGNDKENMGKLNIIVKNIEVLDNNYAYLYGNYLLLKGDKKYSGVTSLLFKFDTQSNSWKIILDHSS